VVRNPSLPQSPIPPGTWTRADSRRALVESRLFDMVVVGGGVIGAAVARDAASRGLSVALVEKDDFAGATSRRSTKLLHGGIRYLPHMRLGLIRQGLREQDVLRRTADFLYSDLDFVIPLFRGRRIVDLPRWLTAGPLASVSLRAGLSLYDRLGGRRGSDRHRRLGKADLARSFPKLRPESLVEGFSYRDALTDDSRLTVAYLKTAVALHGAVAVSRMTACSIDTVGDELRVGLMDSGPEVDDRPVVVRARTVVSATWASAPPPLDGQPPDASRRLSKGVHLVYRAEDLGVGNKALVLPETDDGRLLFVVPWRGLALVGTTDTPYEGDPDRVRPDRDDREYLERHLDRYLDHSGSPQAAFAGLRTLARDRGPVSAASREHRIVERASGVIAVVGGKLSSARVIGAEAVDLACARLRIDRRSRTAREPLFGTGVDATLRERLRAGLARIHIQEDYADDLIGRYGTEAAEVLRILEQRPDWRGLMAPARISVAEVAYTALHESVASIGDFALRRTSLAWRSPDHGRSQTGRMASVLASVLGWPSERAAKEIAVYADELSALGLGGPSGGGPMHYRSDSSKETGD